MAIITNNIQKGANQSFPNAENGSGFVPTGIDASAVVLGDPNDVATSSFISGIVYDSINATVYQQIGGAGGSTWIKLGSTA